MLTVLIARAVLLLAVLLPLSEAAQAHAVVLQTDPEDGAVLADAPLHVRIVFNEPVSLIAVQLLDANGRNVTPRNATKVRDGAVEISVPASLTQGSYVASYRVVSLDGHPVGGSLVFSIGEPGADSDAMTRTAQEPFWPVAWTAVRATLNAGLLGSAGGVLFLLLVASSGTAARQTTLIARRLALMALAAAVLSVGVQGGLLAGGPPHEILGLSIWQTGLGSTFGRSALIGFAGMAVVLVGLSRPSFPGRGIAFAGASLALLSYAFAGHVVTAGPRWLTIPALLVHTAAVAFWVGSLLPLRSILKLENAAAIVRRFSNLAVGAVGLLMIAGILIAALQVRNFPALVASTYGWMLLGKLALVCGLLVLAAINKLRLTPGLSRQDAGATLALRRSIAAELAFVAGILIVTAALGTTPPPRALPNEHAHSPDHHADQAHHSHGLTVELSAAGRRARLAFASAHSGPNAVEIAITDESGDIFEAREVTFVASNPSAGVEPMRRAAVSLRPGVWEVRNLLLVPPGDWSVEVEALISDFEKLMLDGVVEVR